MENRRILYFSDRHDWRKWLEKNFDKQREIWLVFPNKSSGKSRIPYNDAVEEALCFGWIDSTVRKLDASSAIQRFSHRNPKSEYSQQNKERLQWLYKKKLLHSSIKESVKYVLKEKYRFPADIVETLKKDKIAWNNYNHFSNSYKRIRVAYVDGARKRPEEFKKRLNNLIEKTKQNKIIGFGGIDKYY
jgi:uncharacterized protein YdeI (YjbR/CyaY-like superfamily)